jgi:hypothetical protein
MDLTISFLSSTFKKFSIMNRLQNFQNQKTSIPWFFLSINTVLFIILSTLAFRHNLPYLFYAEDGHYMMNLAHEDNLWRNFEFGLTNNFLQSLWGIWFPMNTKFFPGYLIANLFEQNITLSKIIAYVIFSFEFFLIGLMISRIIGLNWNLSIISAWILPFIAYPYYYSPILYNITSLAPQIGTIIVATNLIIILFVSLGRSNQSFLASLWASIGIILLSLFIVFAIPVDISLCVPVISIFGLTYFISCASRPEQKNKIIFSLVILFCLIASGAPFYIYGLIKYSVSYYLPADLRNGVQTIDWSVISILFHGKGRGETWLFVFGFLGSIFYSFHRDNLKKSIARGVLATMVAIVGFGMLLVKFNIWSGPVPIYYEFFLWPFYVAYSVGFVGLLVGWKINSDNTYLRFFILLAPCSILFLSKPIGDIWNIPNPPVRTPIVEMLTQKISLVPGKEFQGRVANFTGQNLTGSIDRSRQQANDIFILMKTGNDHRMNGLWFYNIPTLDLATI